MQFEFDADEAVDAQYPKESDRPVVNKTFMLSGIGVTWSAVPTTSEKITLKLVTPQPISAELLVTDLDPSTGSSTSWPYMIPEGPIPLSEGMLAKVEYPNTNTNTVKVVFLGYWM